MNIATISAAVCAPPNCPATPTSIFSRRSPSSFALKVKAETTVQSHPRSIASLRPAPYSAGLPLNSDRDGQLIFSTA
jgi:hypothetical protein